MFSQHTACAQGRDFWPYINQELQQAFCSRLAVCCCSSINRFWQRAQASSLCTCRRQSLGCRVCSRTLSIVEWLHEDGHGEYTNERESRHCASSIWTLLIQLPLTRHWVSHKHNVKDMDSESALPLLIRPCTSRRQRLQLLHRMLITWWFVLMDSTSSCPILAVSATSWQQQYESITVLAYKNAHD